MKITTHIQKLISNSLEELDLNSDFKIHLEHPTDLSHGDFATNIAMMLFRKQDKFSNPRALAEAIADQISDDMKMVKSVEVAGPGFINFTLSDTFLVVEMASLIKNKATIQETKNKGKKAVVEYMQPNTNKPLHIGHLRNSILGKSVINLLKADGWDVAKATINNDRGLHIIKSMWGYLASEGKRDWKEMINEWGNTPEKWSTPESMELKKLQKPDYFIGHWYIAADKEANNEEVGKEWKEMLLAWENKDSENHVVVRKLWEQMNNWFYQGYEISSKKIGFEFDEDHISYESEIYEAGRQIILEARDKGIFTTLENGAVQAKLERYKLPDKVLLRGDGTGIYMTFDIELTRQRVSYGADKLVWVVGNDQALYFKQLFAISEMLGYGKKEDFMHFSYGMVRLPEGKMSSRKGLVVYADDIVDMSQVKALEIIKEKGMLANLPEEEVLKVSEIVGLGAVKWAMLSMDPLSDIKFDVEKSVSFNGFAGPYVQYTYSRAQSILKKVESLDITNPFDILSDIVSYSKSLNSYKMGESEKELLRTLYTYFEVVEKSADEFAPHHLTTYLFNLAQVFNKFYGNHKVVGGDDGEQVEQFRVVMVIATSLVIKKGLGLLGIEVVSKM